MRARRNPNAGGEDISNFEQLGVFYLGRPFDLATKQPLPTYYLYDSRDLLTHAVVIGMTGSGKTGLCLSLLEEAAIDAVPVIAIDPKGDIGNLLLSFPALSAQSLLPWVDPEQARRLNLTSEQFAQQEAERWQKGLSESDQSLERIAKFRQSACLSIYTPGSTSGIPLSMLKSFSPPADSDDPEVMKDKLQNAVMAILAMAGIKADPLRSREYILLASILEAFWTAGETVSLASLVQSVQKPPIQQIGAFDLESFYPAKERFELAMTLNNLVASPGFEVWTQGEPLNIDRLLYTATGQPCVSIISIAHLNDAERMFVTTLILNELVAWMREQRGTTSLRAILYMDELYGYLPPVENPPSKRPLLTLLKQARAFGLGVVLSTQNPVDLDYKALSNAGTWFIGRLQTERDKKRLLDGLEEASTASGAALNRAETEELLSSLGNRVFMVHNVHDQGSQVFQARWAMSYLRGPLTRTEIKELMKDHALKLSQLPTPSRSLSQSANNPAGGVAAAAGQAAPPMSGTTGDDGEGASRFATTGGGRETATTSGTTPPAVPPQIQQYFLVSGNAAQTFSPQLIATARVQYADVKSKLNTAEDVTIVVPFSDNDMMPIDWSAAERARITPQELSSKPAPGATFASLPGAAVQPKNYTRWSKDFTGWLMENCQQTVFKHQDTKLVSTEGETEAAFKVRVRQRLRELRDAAADDLHRRYATRFAALKDRKLRAQQAVERETLQAQQTQWQSAVDVGAGILGAFMGSRRAASSSMRRVAGSANRAVRQRQDVEHAETNLASVDQQIADLEAQFQTEMSELEAQHAADSTLESVEIRPKKAGISVQLVALLWLPDHGPGSAEPDPSFVANSRSR